MKAYALKLHMMSIEEEALLRVKAKRAKACLDHHHVFLAAALQRYLCCIKRSWTHHLPKNRSIHNKRNVKSALAATLYPCIRSASADNFSGWRFYCNYDSCHGVIYKAACNCASHAQRGSFRCHFRRNDGNIALVNINVIRFDHAHSTIHPCAWIPTRQQLSGVGLDDDCVCATVEIWRCIGAKAEIAIHLASAWLVIHIGSSVAHDTVKIKEHAASIRRGLQDNAFAVVSNSLVRQLASVRIPFRIERPFYRPVVRNFNRTPFNLVARKLPPVVETSRHSCGIDHLRGNEICHKRHNRRCHRFLHVFHV